MDLEIIEYGTKLFKHIHCNCSVNLDQKEQKTGYIKSAWHIDALCNYIFTPACTCDVMRQHKLFEKYLMCLMMGFIIYFAGVDCALHIAWSGDSNLNIY
jgi:hypothetical protein